MRRHSKCGRPLAPPPPHHPHADHPHAARQHTFVILGAPKDWSSRALRPLGPRVTCTASASWFTPASIRARASAPKRTSLAAKARMEPQRVAEAPAGTAREAARASENMVGVWGTHGTARGQNCAHAGTVAHAQLGAVQCRLRPHSTAQRMWLSTTVTTTRRGLACGGGGRHQARCHRANASAAFGAHIHPRMPRHHAHTGRHSPRRFYDHTRTRKAKQNRRLKRAGERGCWAEMGCVYKCGRACGSQANSKPRMTSLACPCS